MKRILFVAITGLLLSCSQDKNGIKFTKDEYSGKWPFTVDEIEVYCDGYKEIYMKADNGDTYALNSSAKSASAEKRGLSDIDEIWLDNPDVPGTKLPYSDFIEQGLLSCENK